MRVGGRMCRGGHRHAPTRLLHSLRSLSRLFLIDVGLRLIYQLDGRLHDLGGVGDPGGAAHELGALPTDCEQCIKIRWGYGLWLR